MRDPVEEPPAADNGPETVAFDETGAIVEFDAADLTARRDIHHPGVLRTLYAILGHPTASASIQEIMAVTDESYTTVRDRLERLKERDPAFVNKRTVPEDKQENNMPKHFFTVTEYTAEILKELGRYNEIKTISAAYHAWDRPEKLQAIEAFDGRPPREEK